MKCSLGISNFLEEISSFSHSIIFHHLGTLKFRHSEGIYTIETGKYIKSGLFSPESQMLNTPWQFAVPNISATFPLSSILSYSCQRMRGSGKWCSCCCKQHCNHLLTKKAIFELYFPLSSDHYSVYYCIWGQAPMGIWLFITSESFFCTVICQAFIYSRQHLIEILKMAWTLNDKQMRRSDENHTCLKAMCFHVKYIWDF